MNKKFFITLATIFSIILFGITYSFAGNNIGEDAVEGVRNFVNGAENVVEDTAKDVEEGIRSGVTDVKDTTNSTNININSKTFIVLFIIKNLLIKINKYPFSFD